jgi:hypothetical protein
MTTPSAPPAAAPDWDGFLLDAAELFEAAPDLARLDVSLEPDTVGFSGERPLPEGFRALRARLFVESKAGKSLSPRCALALVLAAQASWVERGIARIPEESVQERGPAHFLLLAWPSAWPLAEAGSNATFGAQVAFADRALSWFFPADPNAPRGIDPYRAAQFSRRAPEFRRQAEADETLRQERQAARAQLPPAGSVSFREAIAIAREARSLPSIPAQSIEAPAPDPGAGRASSATQAQGAD